MITVLQTARLQLRQLTTADTDFIIELLNSPGFLRFIGDRNVRTTAQATGYLVNGPLKSYADNGFGLFLVALKDTQAPIGICGLIKRDFLEYIDIGFAFLPEYTAQGYAFEIATATMQYARTSLHIQTIAAIVDPTNERSINLLQKLGLEYNRMMRYPDSEEELMLFLTE
jgi:RimJ/RimL family protein N-acetyltransferase